MSISFNNNFIGHVIPRTGFTSIGMGGLDEHGAVLLCSLTYPQPCASLRVTNNIVAGAIFVGFATGGSDCGDNAQMNFRNNVAHSIAGGGNGAGATVWPDPSKPAHKECF